VRTAIVTSVLLLAVAANAMGQDTTAQSLKHPAPPGNAIPTRQSDADKSGVTGTPCLFDPERGEVPDCLRKGATGELFIATQYLKELNFDAHGLAAVNSLEEGWMYVNREGRIVIDGVPVMDNGADWFHDGLVRIVRNGKYGFANRRGQIVVLPIYDGALNFEKGRAEVCKGCKSKCDDPDCEYHSFAGGEWFQIDVKGTVLTRLPPQN
jgi:WG containing repeat